MFLRTTQRGISRRRTAAAAGAALVLAIGGLLATSTAAHASQTDITCAVGTFATTFSPPLTNTPHDTTANLNVSYSCVSLLSPISSGTAQFQNVVPGDNCLLAVQPPTVT